MIYDHESSSGTQLVRASQEPVLWEGRGGEQREGVRSEREKLNERDRAKRRGAHHNKTSPTFKQVELQTDWLLSFSPRMAAEFQQK